MKLVLAILLGATTLGNVSVHASDEPTRFIERKSEGWFFYKDPKELPPPPSPILVPPKPADTANKAPDKDQQEPFSVSWLRENMPKLLDAAIDNPSKENVEAYMYAQRVAMDKS